MNGKKVILIYFSTAIFIILVSLILFSKSPYVTNNLPDLNIINIVSSFFYYLPSEIAGFFTVSFDYPIIIVAPISIVIYYSVFFIPLLVYLYRRKIIWIILQVLIIIGQLFFVTFLWFI